MNAPPRILVVDDQPDNVEILVARLSAQDYEVLTAHNGLEALERARDARPDLILLDVHMPEMDGLEFCRRLRADPDFPFTPIVMVTALSATQDVVSGLECGADEYLTKPFDQAALVARVQSMLRIKALHDTVSRQADELREWNHTLEDRVRAQVQQLERVGRLKRFFSTQLVERLVTSGDESILDSHRREITVVFCDLRGFTRFCESVPPAEVMTTLREYHARMGRLILEFEGTLERFAGDGFMVFFNDPEPVPDHAERAVRMTLAMRDAMDGLCTTWRERGHELGFGVGIANGEATMGMVGFEGRIDYAAIGPVTNPAARLSDRAKAGEILISEAIRAKLDGRIRARPIGRQALKGFPEDVPVHSVSELLDR